MTEFSPPVPLPPPPPPPIVSFGTIVARLLITGGLEGVQTLLAVLDDADAPPGEEPPVVRLLNALDGIYPDDPSARALLAAAGFDPDVILAVAPAASDAPPA